jgi:hypothetical protein
MAQTTNKTLRQIGRIEQTGDAIDLEDTTQTRADLADVNKIRPHDLTRSSGQPLCSPQNPMGCARAPAWPVSTSTNLDQISLTN